MISYASIVPLIGGMTLPLYNLTNNLPEYILSYEPFKKNDSLLLNYLGDVPYILLDNSVPELKYVDIVSTLCPCAGLSTLNSNKENRGSHSTHNDWILRSSKLVLSSIKPKVLIGESAHTLYTDLGKELVDELKNIAKAAGYSLTLYKTNTILHGVPQFRRRTFYIFWKSDSCPVLPYIKKDYKPLKDYLKEIPNIVHQFYGNHNVEHLVSFRLLNHFLGNNFRIEFEKQGFNGNRDSIYHWIVKNNKEQEMIEFLDQHSLDKDESLDIVSKLRNKKNIWSSKLNIYNDYINAITYHNIFYALHPEENRKLSIQEIMHLMGLPYDFKLKNKSNIKEVCQNVPVQTATDIISMCIEFCYNNLSFSSSSFLRQDNEKQKEDVTENEIFSKFFN